MSGDGDPLEGQTSTILAVPCITWAIGGRMDGDSYPAASETPRSRSSLPFLPQPSPELEPTIFGRIVGQRERWTRRFIILVLFNWLSIVALLFAFDDDSGPGQRFVGVILAVVCFGVSIHSIRASERRRVRAGKNWISEDGRKYVRLDLLTRAEVYLHPGNNKYVRFFDSRGTILFFPTAVIQRNKMLHRLILEALSELDRQGRNVFESPEKRQEFFRKIKPYDSRPYEADDHP